MPFYCFLFFHTDVISAFGKVGEEYLLKAARRTYSHTFTAELAKAIVDGCKIVLYGNGTVGTGLFTLFTADAGIFASLHGIGTLLFVAAHHNDPCFLGNHGYDMLGAFLAAQTAADTAGCHNTGNAVFEANCIVGTDIGTIPKTETAETAGVCSTVQHGCGTAGLYAVILSDFCHCIAVAVAGNKGNNVLDFLCFNAEKTADLVCHLLISGNTKTGFYSAFCQSCGIVVTALKSAGTAIDTGQTFSYVFFKRILLHIKKTGEYQ